MTISNLVILLKEDRIENVRIVEGEGNDRIYIHMGNCSIAMDKDQFVELANLLFARVLADKQEEMKPISVVINDTMKMEDKIG